MLQDEGSPRTEYSEPNENLVILYAVVVHERSIIEPAESGGRVGSRNVPMQVSEGRGGEKRLKDNPVGVQRRVFVALDEFESF